MTDVKIRQSALSRFVRHPLVLLASQFVGFVVLYGLTGVAASGYKPLRNTPAQVVITLACAVLAIWLYTLMRRRMERQEPSDFAPQGALGEGLRGLVVGAVLFSATVAVVAALGGISFDGVRGTGRLWSMLAMAIGTGLFEEIIFRGIVFRHIETMAGSAIALFVTSAFFGMAHLANPDATWFAALSIAVEAGVLLGAAYMFTRRLWLACGIHAAWNFTQGWVFSAPVSGGTAPEGLLVTRLNGPEWLTGGGFGLEASLPAVLVATSAGVVLLAMAVRRGHYAPLPWLARRQGPAQTKL